LRVEDKGQYLISWCVSNKIREINPVNPVEREIILDFGSVRITTLLKILYLYCLGWQALGNISIHFEFLQSFYHV